MALGLSEPRLRILRPSPLASVRLGWIPTAVPTRRVRLSFHHQQPPLSPSPPLTPTPTPMSTLMTRPSWRAGSTTDVRRRHRRHRHHHPDSRSCLFLPSTKLPITHATVGMLLLGYLPAQTLVRAPSRRGEDQAFLGHGDKDGCLRPLLKKMTNMKIVTSIFSYCRFPQSIFFSLFE